MKNFPQTLLAAASLAMSVAGCGIGDPPAKTQIPLHSSGTILINVKESINVASIDEDGDAVRLTRSDRTAKCKIRIDGKLSTKAGEKSSVAEGALDVSVPVGSDGQLLIGEFMSGGGGKWSIGPVDDASAPGTRQDAFRVYFKDELGDQKTWISKMIILAN